MMVMSNAAWQLIKRWKTNIGAFKRRRKRWFWSAIIATGCIVFIISSSMYLLSTSPYSRNSVIEQPFTTDYVNGKVTIAQHYTPRIYSGWWATMIGYYRQAVAIVWDRIENPKMPGGSEKDIIAQIHALRFDPSKPYVISGDQFDGLYLRNLGTFYQDLLNHQTALDDSDWHNRQRIAVQTVAYGLAALEQLRRPVTTLFPISPHGVLAVDVYGYPSDTMFSLLQTIQKLEADPATHDVTQRLVASYHDGIAAAYINYLNTVRDDKTGMVRPDVHLSSARDAVNRSSSFYDNVILWRTEQLATSLGFDTVSDSQLAKLRTAIMVQYWDDQQGHFIDDKSVGNQHSYSSDWLIALPTGYLNPANPDDLAKLQRISAYIDDKKLASPLPIRYATTNAGQSENWMVTAFMGSYGNAAIWSYWGNLYIQMQIDLYLQTHDKHYAEHVNQSIAVWDAAIVRDRGYPETLDDKGQLLTSLTYQSIIRNGWVVGFEAVKGEWRSINQ